MPKATKKTFNLSQAIREYREQHPTVTCTDALIHIRGANPGAKINDGTFKSTFYKQAGAGKAGISPARRVGAAIRRTVTDNGRASVPFGSPLPENAKHFNRVAMKDGLTFLGHFDEFAQAIDFLDFVDDVRNTL
jgi:hypothetical protein